MVELSGCQKSVFSSLYIFFCWYLSDESASLCWFRVYQLVVHGFILFASLKRTGAVCMFSSVFCSLVKMAAFVEWV